MELSTLEFVVENLSASSIGGPFGVIPALASALESGSGVRLVEAWLAGSPGTVWRAFFLPGTTDVTIFKRGCAIPLRRHLSPDHIPFYPTGPCCPSLASRRRFGLPPRKSPLQNAVAFRKTEIRENGILLKGMRLRSLSPGRPGLTLGNQQ